MQGMALNKKDLTRDIIYELQKIAFADSDRDASVKIHHKLSAIKELIKLLDLTDVVKNPTDYLEPEEEEAILERKFEAAEAAASGERDFPVTGDGTADINGTARTPFPTGF